MLAARASVVVLSLVSVVLTTRILSPEGYAGLAYLILAAALIVSVAGSWSAAAVPRYGRERLESGQSLVPLSWARLTLMGPLVLIAAAAVIGLKLAGILPEQLTWPLAWIALGYGCVLVLTEHISYFLQAAGRIKTSAAIQLAQQLFVIIALGVVVATDASSTPAVVGGVFVAAAAMAMLISGSTMWTAALWPPAREPELLRRIVMFSAPLVAFTVSQYVIRSVDFVVIGIYETAADVGRYALAYQGYNVLQQVAQATGPVLTPLFVSLAMAERHSLISRHVERMVPQLVLASAALAGVSAPILWLAVPIVFGAGFEEAALPMTLLVVPAVLFFASMLMAPVLLLHERTRTVGLINLRAAAVNVVADFVLIGWFGMGMAGAAVATGLSLAVITWGYWSASRRCIGSKQRFPLLMLLPLFAGIAPVVALENGAGVATGMVGAVLATLVVLRYASPLSAEDLVFVGKLDMPPAARRIAIRTLERWAR